MLTQLFNATRSNVEKEHEREMCMCIFIYILYIYLYIRYDGLSKMGNTELLKVQSDYKCIDLF